MSVYTSRRSIKNATFIVVIFFVPLQLTQAAEPSAGNPAKASIDALTFKPRDVNSETENPCIITFRLGKPALVKLIIKDWDGEVVARREVKCQAGVQKLEWNAAFDSLPRTDGLYTYRLEAVFESGELQIYDPGLDSALDVLPVEKSAFNSQNGELNYLLPRMGMVRIRLYRGQDLLICTIQDWAPQLSGNHKYIWNGDDQSGNSVAKNISNLRVSITSYSLPENAFFVFGTGRQKPARSLNEQIRWHDNPSIAKKFNHARTPRERSHDSRLTLSFLNQLSAEKMIAPLEISGPVLVRVMAPESDISFLTDERFEICIYIDGMLLFEDEDGTLPYNFKLDTMGLNEGKHLLSVWLLTTGDHMGLISVPFTFSTGKNTSVTKPATK